MSDCENELLAAQATITALSRDLKIAQQLYDDARATEDAVFGWKDRPPGQPKDVVHELRRRVEAAEARVTALSQENQTLKTEMAQVTTQLETDRQLVFAIATESADELVKMCGVHPNGDNERLNYLAELFAPEPDTALSAPETEERGAGSRPRRPDEETKI